MECELCDYDLTGLRTRAVNCPECGARVHWGAPSKEIRREGRVWALSLLPALPFVVLSVGADLLCEVGRWNRSVFNAASGVFFVAAALGFLGPLVAFVWLVSSQRRTRASSVMYGLLILFVGWLANAFLLTLGFLVMLSAVGE